MKKFALMMLGLTAALPLHAQDSATTPPPDASSTSSPPPADSNATPPPADASATPPSDSSTPPPTDTSATPPATTESAPATTEAAPTSTEAAPATTEAAPATTEATPPAESTPTVETPPAEGAPAEAAAAPSESRPWIFYVGADYGSVKVSISDIHDFYPNKSGGFDYANKVYLGRIGMRVTDAIGLEFHYGKGKKDDADPTLPYLDQTFGVYLVPTGTLLDVVEFGFPLGYSWAQITANDTTVTADGVSYGMNVEFPFKLIWDAMPDIRIGGGGMVYQQNNNTRVYGWHAGVRWDFALGGGAVAAPPPAPAPEPAPAPPAEEAPPPPPPPPCQAPVDGQPANLEGCKGGETLVLKGVNFEFNKSTLTTNAKTLLDQVAEELNKHPNLKFEIDGHTDGKGTDAYNTKLSDRRAKSVADYLASKGVDKSRMTSKGFGESMPIADNNTDEGREQNRRVELKVLEAGGAPAAAPEAQAAPAAESQPAPATEAAPAPATEAAPAAGAEAAPAGQTPPPQ